jgi:hypothetical protein
MAEIIIPGKSGITEAYDPSSGAMIEAGVCLLPDGYRLVGTCTKGGDPHDLGQNAEGQFALFRRCTDPYSFYSHHKAERLAPEDMQGFFGMSLDYVQAIDEDDEYSSLCKSNLVKPDFS